MSPRHGSVILAALLLSACAQLSVDWPVYGGSAAGDRYSKLHQINSANVSALRIAWRYDTGAGGLQMSPIVIGGTLYGCTPTQKVVALDGVTGKLEWEFDPGVVGLQPVRGLTYWTDGRESRLFTSSGHDLYALDPASGRPIVTFGQQGRIDLRKGLDRDYTGHATFLTSPGVIYRDLIIVGFRTAETKPAAPGAIRAYDVRTGALRWIFHLIPRPGEAGYETWPEEAWKTAGAANAWAGMVVDPKRGIVYASTGSAAFDFYGADRRGNDLYANSLIALDANSGKYLWHFQAVHHDILDRDFPSPPVLLTVRRAGRRIDAVAQTSKQGYVFLFDRVTGQPLFPIEERPAPKSDVPGEYASPTQPAPLRPAPYARQQVTEDLLTTRTPEAHAAAVKEFESLRNEGPFTPLTLGRQTIVFPGLDGGAEWGGPAVDRRSGVIYINSNDIAWLGGLVERASQPAASHGAELYQTQCAICHGIHREGAPPEVPQLADVASRLNSAQISEAIARGRGRMPGFPQLNGPEAGALIAYLTGDTKDPAPSTDREVPSTSPGAADQSPYIFTGYKRWLDADGYPAVKPPWGTLNAIDLNTGEYVWKIPLGEYPALAAQGVHDTGTNNYGGPLVTAGGLVFIGATVYDRKFRAFDSRTGKKVWEAELPFAGVATPILYKVKGREYVVIACSGQRDRKGPQGSAYVAFALPQLSAQE
jgi:quinoprotein glucose dehydrogenase